MQPNQRGIKEGKVFRQLRPKQQVESGACPPIDDALADVFLQSAEAPASSVAPERRRLVKKGKM